MRWVQWETRAAAVEGRVADQAAAMVLLVEAACMALVVVVQVVQQVA